MLKDHTQSIGVAIRDFIRIALPDSFAERQRLEENTKRLGLMKVSKVLKKLQK